MPPVCPASCDVNDLMPILPSVIPHAHYPMVVGFEVPVLTSGRVPADASIGALLDTAPTSNGVKAFEREAVHLKQ